MLLVCSWPENLGPSAELAVIERIEGYRLGPTDCDVIVSWIEDWTQRVMFFSGGFQILTGIIVLHGRHLGSQGLGPSPARHVGKWQGARYRRRPKRMAIAANMTSQALPPFTGSCN